jgi:hypothetical protein
MEVKSQEEKCRGECMQQTSIYRSSQRRRKTKIESRWISFRNPVSWQIQIKEALGLPSRKAKQKSLKEG